MEDYEALALRLATTPEMLSDIKARLARNRTTHPLFDTDRFRRHIESAYVAMWQRYQRGEPPESFEVQPIQRVMGDGWLSPTGASFPWKRESNFRLTMSTRRMGSRLRGNDKKGVIPMKMGI